MPVRDALRAGGGYETGPRRYTFGPMAELRLPFGLGIEMDALYQRVGYRFQEGISGRVVTGQTTGNSWTFPVLAKYRFPGFLARPYVGVGASVHRLTDLREAASCAGSLCGAFTRTESDTPAALDKRGNIGVILEGGLELRAIILRIAPELRYTRWNSSNFSLTGAHGAYLYSNRNQVELLLGISF